MDFGKVAESLIAAGRELTTKEVSELMRAHFYSLSDNQRAQFCEQVSRMSREELIDLIVNSFKRKPDHNLAKIFARVLREFYNTYEKTGNLKFISDIAKGGGPDEGSTVYYMIRYYAACLLLEVLSEKEIVTLISAQKVMSEDGMATIMLTLDSVSRRGMAARAVDSLMEIVSEYQRERRRAKGWLNWISF